MKYGSYGNLAYPRPKWQYYNPDSKLGWEEYCKHLFLYVPDENQKLHGGLLDDLDDMKELRNALNRMIRNIKKDEH